MATPGGRSNIPAGGESPRGRRRAELTEGPNKALERTGLRFPALAIAAAPAAQRER